MSASGEIQVFLIEDNRLLREGIAAVLNEHSDFAVVAQSKVSDAVRRLEGLDAPPQIILLDLELTMGHSLDLMAWLQAELPDAKVIAMDILPEQVNIVEFVAAGGCGFILKDATESEYITTIKAVADGAKVLPSVLTKSLFTQIIENALKSGALPDTLTKLTSREREIVNLIAEGLSNKEIAQRLHISTHTVKSHVHNILEKLALSTRLEVAAFVRRERGDQRG